MKINILAAILGFALSGGAQAATSTFDDLPLAAESYFFPQTTTTFASGGATFNHSYTDFGGCCHADWIYSNKTDNVTAGYSNQFSAYPGGGAQGSSNYGIAYMGSPTVSFASPVNAASAYFANTTYAALSMKSGDGFSKEFGGASGNDPDWFKLIILGKDAGGVTTGSKEFYLADFRFADNTKDYIVSNWTFVDLAGLGTFNSLSFALDSSDKGSFGMNTPAYFAMDSLSVTAVPEPEQAALLLAGLALVGGIARRRRQAT